MSYFYPCPDCKANLDPGEICECKSREAVVRKEDNKDSLLVYTKNYLNEGLKTEGVGTR